MYFGGASSVLFIARESNAIGEAEIPLKIKNHLSRQPHIQVSTAANVLRCGIFAVFFCYWRMKFTSIRHKHKKTTERNSVAL